MHLKVNNNKLSPAGAFGKLYLIPSTLGECCAGDVLPRRTVDVVNRISRYVVENTRSARRFLSRLKIAQPIDSLSFTELNEHTPDAEVAPMLAPLLQGFDVGIISEAGAPTVADPGAALVSAAHEKGIRVIPLVGPSSILLALMAAGFNGQSFAFAGYLPIKSDDRNRCIRRLERLSAEGQTQIFMETPYRNNKLLADVIDACSPHTKLCIAADITLEAEFIATKTIAEWKKGTPDLSKRPCIFVMQQQGRS
ncbi:MAG: SAM-dependent methyltransferase [Prevotellaceae bacterium]|jgi:16S rRNA (cytidine1402-2'-O)-methyltransferase|nr:SAM-dependent methyltransferase [Prevotellaceae bacterium]